MQEDVMTVQIDELMAVFFEAMRSGYASASGGFKNPLTGFPGSKHLLFVTGDYRVSDVYFVTKSGPHSSGMTIIWYKESPVWTMQYLGWYLDEAIPTLKAALRVSYDCNIFLGGRGPLSYMASKVQNDWPFIYTNQVEKNDPGFFFGEERIIDSEGRLCGMHRYQGMLLDR